jgi:hypothetical protein
VKSVRYLMGKTLILKPLLRSLNTISFMLIILTFQLIQTIRILWFCHRAPLSNVAQSIIASGVIMMQLRLRSAVLDAILSTVHIGRAGCDRRHWVRSALLGNESPRMVMSVLGPSLMYTNEELALSLSSSQSDVTGMVARALVVDIMIFLVLGADVAIGLVLLADVTIGVPGGYFFCCNSFSFSSTLLDFYNLGFIPRKISSCRLSLLTS